MFKKLLIGITLISLTISNVIAGELPIGDPIEINGMEIAAVYLQAVKMEPMVPMNKGADIHLEADIHAIKGNKNGFGEGEWIPYLEISYQVSKVGQDWITIGTFMPMVASDGPHYGANIALNGAGKYKIKYQINPPPYRGMYRHTDKETGVEKWWKPFTAEWDFKYIGTGKKGGY
ncbi:MAG: iron transporter [Candidatus Marithrix sp.]|nr:iron transporter [Candidatus Marithrix sp.]